jgi:hypothetical protein
LGKIKYTNKEQALQDLIIKQIYIESEEGLIYSHNTHAVVEIGLITLIDPTFDENMNILTDPIFVDDYHYDVMTEEEVVFENEIIVNNPKHMFAGQ